MKVTYLACVVNSHTTFARAWNILEPVIEAKKRAAPKKDKKVGNLFIQILSLLQSRQEQMVDLQFPWT